MIRRFCGEVDFPKLFNLFIILSVGSKKVRCGEIDQELCRRVADSGRKDNAALYSLLADQQASGKVMAHCYFCIHRDVMNKYTCRGTRSLVTTAYKIGRVWAERQRGPLFSSRATARVWPGAAAS